MALNIPNVGSGIDTLMKGVDTGSSMFARLMDPILKREEEKRLAEQFQQDLALKKAQEARLGANSDLNRQILQQQLLGLKHENDPTYELQQYKALEDFIKGRGMGATQGASQVVANAPVNMPTKPMGEGMGVFSPQGLQQMQTIQQAQQTKANLMNGAPTANSGNAGGFDMELLKQNPYLRGFFKKKFGYDPISDELSYQGPARDAYDLKRLKDTYGEDSDVYKMAKQQYQANVDAKQDLSDIRARTKAGLKTGEKEFFDEKTGAPLGKEVPLTEKERESEQGNILFNELYPYVYKGASPFSGEGSITKLQQAAANYKTDPKAKKLFDDFLLAEKMLAATTVNEASTLKAGRTNRTYNMLKESLDAQDIPVVIKKLIKQYNLPSSAQLQAAVRYQNILSDARNKSIKMTPATQKLFYNPEMQANYDANKDTSSPTGKTTVIVIDPNNKRYETTEENAANLPKGWKRG